MFPRDAYFGNGKHSMVNTQPGTKRGMFVICDQCYVEIITGMVQPRKPAGYYAPQASLDQLQPQPVKPKRRKPPLDYTLSIRQAKTRGVRLWSDSTERRSRNHSEWN